MKTVTPIGLYDDSPVVCQDYDPRAPLVAAIVAQMIESRLSGIRVEHVGSTSVPGCSGKGTVDLIVLYPAGRLELTRDVLGSLGFQKQTTRDPFPEDRPMRTGSIEFEGQRFRLHAHVLAENSQEARELREFRDRLRADARLVDDYVARKKEIIASGVTDGIDYSIAKTDFIKGALGSQAKF